MPRAKGKATATTVEIEVKNEEMIKKETLHQKIVKGNVVEVQDLIAFGIDIKKSIKKETLHQKIVKGNVVEVQNLIAFGIDINATDDNENSPLSLAASCGDVDIINLLIQNNANIAHKNKLGYTAFHLASLEQHLTVMEILLEYGANVDEKNKMNYTPLMNAAGRGDLQTVKFLTKHGAYVNYSTKKGMTPLHKACLADSTAVSIAVVEHLISVGANINKIRKNRSKLQLTPFEDAAAMGHVHIMKYLVENGAKIPMDKIYNAMCRMTTKDPLKYLLDLYLNARKKK